MTIEEMLELFDIIQDKKNSTYFEDEEKLLLLNRAQIIFISEHIENNFPGIFGSSERGFISDRGIENTVAGSDVIKPLIVNVRYVNQSETSLNTNSNGLLYESNIVSGITYHSGVTSLPLKILSIAVEDSEDNEVHVTYVRHNDLYKFLRNTFLIPTEDNPIYVIDGNNYQLYPNVQYDQVLVSLIRYPIEMIYIDNGNPSNVDCELDDSYHDRIIAIALDIAGVSSRDSALLGLKNILNNQDRNG